MIIQRADISHAEFIAHFQVDMALETENLKLDLDTVKKGVAAVFENPSHGTYFVCLDEERVIASLLITYEWSDWRNRQTWWIQSVFVSPEFRGKGVFKKMYSYLKDIVQNDEGLSGLRLYVDKTNTNAQKVYEKLDMDGEHYFMYEWMK